MPSPRVWITPSERARTAPLPRAATEVGGHAALAPHDADITRVVVVPIGTASPHTASNTNPDTASFAAVVS